MGSLCERAVSSWLSRCISDAPVGFASKFAAERQKTWDTEGQRGTPTVTLELAQRTRA
jgi:hypothetical protein